MVKNMKLAAKLLDYFLSIDKSNINQNNQSGTVIVATHIEVASIHRLSDIFQTYQISLEKKLSENGDRFK